jgi:hypothetical protein
VDATTLHQGPNSSTTVYHHSGNAGDNGEGEPDEDEVVEDDAVDAAAHEVSIVKATDWRLVADFEDPLASQDPTSITDCQGRLRVRVAMTPCDLFSRSSLWPSLKPRSRVGNPISRKSAGRASKLFDMFCFEVSVVASKNGS